MRYLVFFALLPLPSTFHGVAAQSSTERRAAAQSGSSNSKSKEIHPHGAPKSLATLLLARELQKSSSAFASPQRFGGFAKQQRHPSVAVPLSGSAAKSLPQPLMVEKVPEDVLSAIRILGTSEAPSVADVNAAYKAALEKFDPAADPKKLERLNNAKERILAYSLNRDKELSRIAIKEKPKEKKPLVLPEWLEPVAEVPTAEEFMDNVCMFFGLSAVAIVAFPEAFIVYAIPYSAGHLFFRGAKEAGDKRKEEGVEQAKWPSRKRLLLAALALITASWALGVGVAASILAVARKAGLLGSRLSIGSRFVKQFYACIVMTALCFACSFFKVQDKPFFQG